jgi:1-phosphofructokinase
MSARHQPAIITVTLNPAIDSTLYFKDFQVGQVNRIGCEISDPGGKGVNVAKVIKALGYEVGVTGFLGKNNATVFHDYFRQEQIEDYFIEVGGTTRTNIKIVDEKSGQVSEINFPGLQSLATDLLKLDSILKELAHPDNLFVFSGSLPQDAPLDIYRKLTADLVSRGCKVFLDTSGLALAEGIQAKPYAVKPNISELSELTGRNLQDDADIMAAIDQILATGVMQVVVSLGAQGALAANHEKKLRVIPPRVQVQSTVGAGDAMVAGLAAGEAQGLPLIECVRLATAAAAASVAKPGTRAGSLLDVENLRGQVIIEEIR